MREGAGDMMLLVCYAGSADAPAPNGPRMWDWSRGRGSGIVATISPLVVPSPSLAEQHHHRARHAQITAGIT